MRRPGVLLIAATALGVSALGCRPTTSPVPAASLKPPLPDWNVTFRDVAAEAGLDYQPANGDKSPLTILDVGPGGGAFADFDGDGRLDILIAAPPRCALYRNQGRGRFTEVTSAWGLDIDGPWMGCTVGDYDNDGFLDLFVTGYRRCALFRNSRGQKFIETTRAAGLANSLWTTSAAFGDVDGDGWLDLYVGAYVQYHVGRQDHCAHGSTQTACGPEAYEAEKGRLYRNLRNGRFSDETRRSGLEAATGKTWGVAFADADSDGRQDLYLANDQVPGNLFRNRGEWKFEDIGTSSGTAYDATGQVQGGMGVDWGDFNEDGRLDLFVTTYAQQPKELYLNEGSGLFHPASGDIGLSALALPYVAFGGGFLDADNDGHLDLFLASGHIRDNAAAVDASQSYAQPLQLLANLGAGNLTDVSSRAGPAFAKPAVGRGVAFGDYDDDGRTDLLVIDLEGRARLLHNEGGVRNGNWLSVKLDGGRLNREAIGARIWVEAAGRRRLQEVTRGRSVLSASDARAHFGLGSASQAERILVRWPDGRKEEWRGVAANKMIGLRRGSGTPVAADPTGNPPR